MKRKNKLIHRLSVVVLTLLGAGGCTLITTYDKSPYPTIHVEEVAHLAENDPESPFCDFSIDYTYPSEKGDSVASLINRVIQREFLGDDYADLVPKAAVDSFKNTYLSDYLTQTGELYRADVDKNGKESIPEWYTRTYSIVTFVEEGYANTLNASANFFEDLAGTHPNQWSRWLNFDNLTGQMLTTDDVFQPDTQKEIEQILLQKLITHVAKLHPKENIVSLEIIRDCGYLTHTDMYIPENFLLSKKGLLFLFNRYDIAPYSMGEIVLEVPYEEIATYLKRTEETETVE